MKYSLAVFALLTFVNGDGPAQLTDANFQDFIDKNPKTLVEFYAPWCGHCKNLEPEYHAAAEKLAEQGVNAKLAQVDATVASGLASKFDVSGYPTLKWFDNGTPTDYAGPRQTDGIVSWVTSRASPAVQKISGKKAAEFGNDGDYTLLGYVKAGSKKEAIFDKMGGRLRTDFEKLSPLKISIGKVVLKKGNGRFYFRRNKFGEMDGEVELQYEGKVAKIQKFVHENMWPLIGPRGVSSQAFLNPHEENDGALAIFADDDEDEDGRSFLESDDDVLEVAADLREKGMHVMWLSQSEAENQYSLTEKPAFLYFARNKDAKSDRMKFKKYKFEPESEDAPEESLKEFVAKAQAGDWPMHYKTQEEPEDRVDENGIIELVGSTFEAQAFDESTDTLVEFYAPWCGHCKKFVPVYEKFSRNVRRYYKGKINVAKINAADNEVDANVSGFPTIIFYPGDDKKGIKFEGSRDDPDDLIDFLEEHSVALNSDEKEEL